MLFGRTSFNECGRSRLPQQVIAGIGVRSVGIECRNRVKESDKGWAGRLLIGGVNGGINARVVRHRKVRGEVAPGGEAQNAEPLWVNPEFGRAGPDQADGTLPVAQRNDGPV